MADGTRELRLVVTAPDYDAALRFYRDVLGLREEASFTDDNGGRASVLYAGRATLELGDEEHAAAIDAVEVGERVAGPVRLAFEVKDAAATTDALVAAGGRLVSRPVRTPWGSLNARLHGPDGQQLTVYANDPYVTPRQRLDGQVVLAEPDPGWGPAGTALVARVRQTLGPVAMVAEHVGSTSVPELPAKPVLDLVVGVPDPVDEGSYVPPLETLGFRLHIREPEWHEHRLLKHTEPLVNLHVFAAGSVEIDRMVAFRDHLRSNAVDRELYLQTKRDLAGRTWEHVQDYADAKADVVEDIIRRALSADAGRVAPTYVLVSGPVGSGKTTLASALAPALGLPLLNKDTVKEALLDSLGAQDVEASRTLGGAAVAVLLALARTQTGAVLEGPWHRDRAHELAALPGAVVEVFCRVDRETARERYRARPDRHPGHFDGHRTDAELWGEQVTDPVAGGWPVLEVDTTRPVDVSSLAARIREQVTR